ncbi:MAG: response regulator [Candidatus Thorarchaeota archaeon]
MSKSGSKKVLIVDEDAFIRNRIKKVVDKFEYGDLIGEAGNREDVITLYKELKPDLVPMDLIMPNVDGVKAIEEIMKFDKKAIIVVVSAMGHELTITDALGKGAKEYIKKPFKEEDIYRTLERFLKS